MDAEHQSALISECISLQGFIIDSRPIFGKMAERSNAAVSKTVVRFSADRGFESPSFRQ
jgi:hypothetical protein